MKMIFQQRRRAFYPGGASWLLLCTVAGGDAMAQDAAAPSAAQLPEITVTAPSPIVRRRAVVPARRARISDRASRSREPTAGAGGRRATTGRAADRDRSIRHGDGGSQRGNSSRGHCAARRDLLCSEPGITGSTFAPGASSRPIIRGLDVNRVGILENGNNAGGASDLGEDHLVPVDPLATNQVEVIRGPAALRYGSISIGGGVVSATNNRIPDALPTCGLRHSSPMDCRLRRRWPTRKPHPA
jgi:iron complex outermembrane recepter protein